MDILFAATCVLMTALLMWGLGWYYLIASGLGGLLMMALFKISRH